MQLALGGFAAADAGRTEERDGVANARGAEATVGLEVFGEDADRAGVTLSRNCAFMYASGCESIRNSTTCYHAASRMSDTTPSLRKVLGIWDLVTMNIVAVVGPRWISRSARAGPPSITFWLLAWRCSSCRWRCRHRALEPPPDEGGLYRWARRAFGPVHGFMCGWCVWVNNLFYFPSLLLFVAANVLLVFGPGAATLADSRIYSTDVVLGRPRLLHRSSACGASAPAGGCNASG